MRYEWFRNFAAYRSSGTLLLHISATSRHVGSRTFAHFFSARVYFLKIISLAPSTGRLRIRGFSFSSLLYVFFLVLVENEYPRTDLATVSVEIAIHSSSLVLSLLP